MEKSNKGIMEKLFEVKKSGIKLQRDTKAFNYKYATLSQIQDKFSDVLQEQKLVITHYIENNCVVTEIHDIEYATKVISSIPMSEGTKPQDKGSEITYYRRYNLLSLLDLEVEDDDGKKAQESKVEEKEEKKWLNYESFKEIVEAGNTTEQQIAKAIQDEGFTLSNQAKIAVRHYVDKGEILKNLFFKPK